jgi:hypothetical protein
MQKLAILIICCTISYQANADYYEEFAKQYEKDYPEIAHPSKKTLTVEETFEAWRTAYSHFKPGYRPVLDENGVLLDWVSNCPND